MTPVRSSMSGPQHLVDVDRFVETLDPDKTLVRELKALPEAQLAHRARHQHAPALARRAHPSRELNGSAEEVVAFGDRLPGTHGCADLERHLVTAAALRHRLLDRDRGLDCATHRR